MWVVTMKTIGMRLLGAPVMVAFAISVAQAQQPKYKAGDRIEAAPTTSTSWGPATVVSVTMWNGNVAGYFVRMDAQGGQPAFEATVGPSQMRPLSGGAASVPAQAARAAQPQTAAVAAAAQGQAQQFQIGQRVMVSISGHKEESAYQPCTIIRELQYNSYGVRCDPANGLSFMEYSAQPSWIRASSGMAAAPQVSCSFDVPPGKVTKGAAPSAQLFKRIIYEHELPPNFNGRYGMVFQDFAIGSIYPNSIEHGHLILTGVPQGGKIYPVRTKFTTCREGDARFDYKMTTQMDFACAVDNFGTWSCGAGSTPVYTDKVNVPKA
jgi:hypothetical protein